MKTKKLIYAGLLAAVCLTTTGCGETTSQGVTETSILVGNAAATSGAFATVGGPFNVGLEASLKAYNDEGGFGENGLKVEFKHYDDGFDGAQGLAYTKKLVEEDEIFALVGHFGTPTVGATVDYIKAKGIPMVYAATGISALYNQKAEGNDRAVMSVQPIYDAEGSVLLARALATKEGNLGLGAQKVGVIYTNDEAGKGMLNGIKVQAGKLTDEAANSITYVETSATTGTNHSIAVNTLKTAGCDVVIIAANQAPFVEIMSYFSAAGYENVSVITSYVSANATLAGTMIASGAVVPGVRDVYTTAWLDITSSTYVYAPAEDNLVGQGLWSCYKALVATTFPTFYDAGVPGFSEEYWDAAEAIFGYKLSVDATDYAAAFAASFDSYALAGYIAGKMFVEGLDRVDEAGKTLNWANYIDAMEQERVDVPMGGSVDFTDGQRVGIQDLALNKFGLSIAGAGELQVYSGITTIEDVMNGVSVAK